MIDALISGKLHAKPEARTSKAGKPFCTAKLRAPQSEGEAIFINVIAFDQTAVAALLALDAGDSIAVSGSAAVKTWTDRDGVTHPALDLVAHAVLTSYHVSRKRRAMQPEGEATSRPRDEAWQAMAPRQRQHQHQHMEGLDDGEPLPF